MKKARIKFWLNYFISCWDLCLVDRCDGGYSGQSFYIVQTTCGLNECNESKKKYRYICVYIFEKMNCSMLVMCDMCVGYLFVIAFSSVSMPTLVDLAPRKYWKIWHSFHDVAAVVLIDTQNKISAKKYFFFIEFISWGLPLLHFSYAVYKNVGQIGNSFSFLDWHETVFAAPLAVNYAVVLEFLSGFLLITAALLFLLLFFQYAFPHCDCNNARIILQTSHGKCVTKFSNAFLFALNPILSVEE